MSSGMLKSLSWILAAACLTLVVGPLMLVTAQAGQTDRADLYIIVDGGGSSLSQHELIAYGASGVGPLSGRLAQMIHAPPASRTRLLQAGYIMLPAAALAAICGINTDSVDLIRNS